MTKTAQAIIIVCSVIGLILFWSGYTNPGMALVGVVAIAALWGRND